MNDLLQNQTDRPLVKFKDDWQQSLLSQCELELALQLELSAINNLNDAINLLISNANYGAVVTLISISLPIREAIWWAQLAASQMHLKDDNTEAAAIISAAQNWVYHSNQDNLQIIHSFGQKLECATPADWLAYAICSCADNDDDMAQVAIANTVNLSARLSQNPATSFQFFIAQGLHIARGGNGQIQSNEAVA